jgi:hypothetical protein
MNPTTLINTYLQVWNERDPVTRDQLMRSALTDDVLYTDPDYAGLRGYTELSDAIGRLQEQIGELRFVLDAIIGIHHNHALFTWQLGAAASGYDIAEFTGDRIHRIIGFFLPADQQPTG